MFYFVGVYLTPLSDVEYKPVNVEIKLKSNAKKKFLVDGGILYRLADYLFNAVLSMQTRSFVSLFRSIRQTQSILARTKLPQR